MSDANHVRDLLGPNVPWQPYLVGQGTLERPGASLRLVTTETTSGEYTNAQIDDYHRLPRRRFLWRPPLKMTVRARFSHPARTLRGTAGFGFWNDPFLMTGARLPALPRAIWFFYASPPANMKLDLHTPGRGWKATTIDAARPAALPWLPLAPLLVPLMNVRPLYPRLWPPVQRALKIREALVPADITTWHTYTIEWGQQVARFQCSAAAGAQPQTVLVAPSPRGPLGFVMWLDNQYLVVTPWGRLRWGLLDTPGCQWLEVSELAIEPLHPPAE